MPQRISGVAAAPDHIGKPPERDATQVGQGVEHVTAAMREEEVLDQLADRGMQREYAECPPGPDPHHQESEGRREEDRNVDHLVEPGDPRPCQPLGGIHGDQLYSQGYAESQAPQELLGAQLRRARGRHADTSAGSRARVRCRGSPRHTAGVVMLARAAASTAAATTLATSGWKTPGMMSAAFSSSSPM